MFNLKMKSLFAVAVLFIGVSAANAQLSSGSLIRVNVPNAFVILDETFAAGEYTIERTPSTADSSSLLIIRGEDNSMIFDTMVARTGKDASDTELVFDTVGGVNYLSAIQVKGTISRNEIIKTKTQTRLMAAGQAVRTVITITDTGL